MTEAGVGLSVNYILEDASLYGGVKIVLHQAELLAARGVETRIVSRGPRPSWYDLAVPYLHAPELARDQVPAADVTVATFWKTIEPARRVASAEVVHFCQGFEASYLHNEDEHEAILQAYRAPIPGFGLAPHLVSLLEERFGRPARLVPPALEPRWRPRLRFRPRRRPRILVVHPFENAWKGVPTALDAVLRLRRAGRRCTLVRLSQWPLCADERRIVEPDEFHCGVPPAEVPALVRNCDLLLAPSWEQEGFGLPVLEAMACGVPVVASDISAFRGYAADAATLLPPHDGAAFAEEAAAVLDDARRWRRMRRLGLVVAARFSEERSADAARTALEWVATGAWRRSLSA